MNGVSVGTVVGLTGGGSVLALPSAFSLTHKSISKAKILQQQSIFAIRLMGYC